MTKPTVIQCVNLKMGQFNNMPIWKLFNVKM